MTKKNLTRRDFISTVVAVPIIVSARPEILNAKTESVTISSPNGKVQFKVVRDRPYSGGLLLFKNNLVLRVRLGMVLDGLDLGREVNIESVERYKLNETYPTRGVHSLAINRGNGARIHVTHLASKTNYVLEVRAYNDGVGFRYFIPADADKRRRVPDEVTSFRLDGAYLAWFHDFEGHYEGIHQKRELDKVKEDEWAAPPLTLKLMNQTGYAAITEAALMNYPGMGLQAGPEREFKVVLGHALPVSHPFDLRYGKEEARRLSAPAAIEGAIETPWRVVIVGADLNALVNSDLISNLSPPPDQTIFPRGLNTDFIKPGRAVWRYLDGGDNTFDGMKEFSQLAGELGFEYNVVEGIWQRWTEPQLRELVDYSKQHQVGLWFWKHCRELRTPESRSAFFALLARLGVVGAKIDFFDHEAKEIIDLYQALLRSAAEHKIMVEFHGANKPAGESRTWPNELTREAIRGLEYRSLQTRAVHNTTLPFTRLLAGHADYTPVHFGERRRETSWAHQIATAVVFTSPLLIYGAHPKSILANPAVELIKSIPSVWDETIVLSPSEIGEIAVFARRRGDVWFLAIMNGETQRTIRVPLSFLKRGKYQAMLVRDQPDDAAAVVIEKPTVIGRDSLTIKMRAGGGFVARLKT